MLLLAQGAPALAQDVLIYPILYGGRALVDGQPLPEKTILVARVRDYETWTTVEKDGVYGNLLVAPLSRDYYYGTVTFHALGLTAKEQDVFLPAGAPVFKDVGFDLHFPGPAFETSPEPSPAPAPTVETSPEPSPAPAPTVETSTQPSSATPAATPHAPQPEKGEGGGFSWFRLPIGAGLILVVLVGWFVFSKRWAG